jgi:mannose-6-phosphate isomerase-like protein (cupin superfamily)
MSVHAKRIVAVSIVAAAFSAGAVLAQAPAAGAQAPARGGQARGQAVPLPYDPAAVSQVTIENFREQMVDPGVFYAVIMDRPEVRIGHTRLAPGGARRTHTHDDVTWHLLIPVTGTLTMTVGTDAPIETQPGRAYFMKAGTPHGFTNKGTVDALSIEVFVKPAPKTNAGLTPAAGILAGLSSDGRPVHETTEAEALALAFAAAGAAQR